MISDEQLTQFGFERLMQGYWRKDDFGILAGYDEKGLYYVNFNTIIRTVEELREAYREKTGSELDDIDVIDL